MRTRARRSCQRSGERGQTLVEFALISPVFFVVLIGIMEFAVAFSVQLNVNYASRNAALLGAEAADGAGADCVILQSVESSLNSPSDKSGIQNVRIFWADKNGVEQSGAANVYTRTGSTTCTFSDGQSLTVPYTMSGAAGYPEADRCSIFLGCGGSHADGPDLLGVAITYVHGWVTPLPTIVQLPASGVTFVRSNTMRVEPTL